MFINKPLVPVALRENALIVHPHAQRTGGNTIRRRVLHEAYGIQRIYNSFNVPKAKVWVDLTDADVAGYRAFTGHFDFCDIALSRPYLPIAVLRHPLYRAMSLYHFVRGKAGHRFQQLALATSPEEFYPRASKLGPRYFRNRQCMCVCGVADANLALDFIRQRYLGVGFTEYLASFVDALGAHLNWPPIAVEKQMPDSERYNSQITPKFRDMVLDESAEDLLMFEAMKAGPPYRISRPRRRLRLAVTQPMSRLERAAKKIARRLFRP